MKLSTHTPGQWVAHYFPYGGGLCVVTNPPKNDSTPFIGQVIASKTTCPDWFSNAHLIAAAPDLLAIAEAIQGFINEGEESIPFGVLINHKATLKTAIKAALEKAKGEEFPSALA